MASIGLPVSGRVQAEALERGHVGGVGRLRAGGFDHEGHPGGCRVAEQDSEGLLRRSGPRRCSRAGPGGNRTGPWSRWRAPAAAGPSRPGPRPARPGPRPRRPGRRGRPRPRTRGRCPGTHPPADASRASPGTIPGPRGRCRAAGPGRPSARAAGPGHRPGSSPAPAAGQSRACSMAFSRSPPAAEPVCTTTPRAPIAAPRCSEWRIEATERSRITGSADPTLIRYGVCTNTGRAASASRLRIASAARACCARSPAGRAQDRGFDTNTWMASAPMSAA